jgi:lipopolysaccharide biosynthesis glycosyltransferase
MTLQPIIAKNPCSQYGFPMDTSIPILLCADGAYFQHLAVTLASLLANNRQHRFALTVATDRDYPEEQARLTEMVDGFGNATIAFIVFRLDRLKNLPTNLHLPPLVYIRLFAAELFAPDVEKILYLDTDLAVAADIGALWATELGDHSIAAAPDVFIDAQRGLPPGQYVNCGVMLLNLRQWRQENAQAALLAYMAAHPDVHYLEQDAMNAVFASRIMALPLHWNFQARMAETSPAALGLGRAAFRELRRHPGIVHYTTGSKPWMYRKDVHYKPLYYRYLALTPWRAYRPPDKTLRRVISQYLRLMALRRWLRRAFA